MVQDLGQTCQDIVINKAMRLMRQDWEMLMEMEALASTVNVGPLSEIYWLKHPLIRYLFVTFEYHGWDPKCLEGQRVISALFNNLGDTVFIERMHQKIKDAKTRHQKSDQSSRLTRTATTNNHNIDNLVF